MANGQLTKFQTEALTSKDSNLISDKIEGVKTSFKRRMSVEFAYSTLLCSEDGCSQDVKSSTASTETTTQSTNVKRSLSRFSVQFPNIIRSFSRDLTEEGKRFINTSRLHKLFLMMPIFAGILPPVFISISLGVALVNGNLFHDNSTKFVPYISDIGNFKPQSSIFTFGLSLSCLCTLGTVVIRYLQGDLIFLEETKRVNFVACIFGCFLVIGKYLVASFQLSSSKIVHYLAAFTYIIFAILYCGLQTYISYRNKATHTRLRVYTRLVFVMGMTIGAALFLIFLLPALHRFNRGKTSVAQGGEWLFAALKMAFFVTFYSDFQSVVPIFELIAKPPKDEENNENHFRETVVQNDS